MLNIVDLIRVEDLSAADMARVVGGLTNDQKFLMGTVYGTLGDITKAAGHYGEAIILYDQAVKVLGK